MRLEVNTEETCNELKWRLIHLKGFKLHHLHEIITCLIQPVQKKKITNGLIRKGNYSY